jgi:hypothetical protein
MASEHPPPHVPFALSSSYLLDALVPVPLPFIFLFPILLIIQRSFPFVFGALCAPVWVFQLLAFCSPSPKASPLCAPTAFCFIFCFDFSFVFFFFFLVRFPCICFSISLYCSSLFVLCVFWFFIVLSFFSTSVSPHSVHWQTFFCTPTTSSFQCILQCTVSACTQSVLFSCIFIVFCL